MDAAIAYTKDRKQFGKSISEFQGVQFMLADMAMKVEAAAVDGLLRGGARRAWRARPGLHLVGVEVLCLRVAMEVTTDAVQLFGGAGYSHDFLSSG